MIGWFSALGRQLARDSSYEVILLKKRSKSEKISAASNVKNNSI